MRSVAFTVRPLAVKLSPRCALPRESKKTQSAREKRHELSRPTISKDLMEYLKIQDVDHRFDPLVKVPLV